MSALGDTSRMRAAGYQDFHTANLNQVAKRDDTSNKGQKT